MSSIATLNGVQYIIPAYNDTGWAQGAGNLSLYLAAVAANTLQPTGGSFTLTADVDFGANFGLKALFLKTETANPASAGVLRLAKTDSIKWRNNANGADIALTIDGSDNLTFAATKVLLSGAVVNADINASAAIAYSKLALTGSIVNADVASGAAIAYSKLALSTSIVNADVAAAAAIALTKLAALSSHSRALASDSSGFIVESSVTATELGYVSGVTSALQTQLNATIANPLTSNLAAGAHKITGLANGTAATDAAAFGQIYGGFQAPVQATTATSNTTTSSTFQNTALTASITPTDAAHRIKITVTFVGSIDSATGNAYFTIKRASTNIGGTNGFVAIIAGGTSATTLAVPVSITYIDSPASALSTSYTVQIASSNNSSTVEFLPAGSQKAVIILEEIV